MATIREYFDTDPRGFSHYVDAKVQTAGSKVVASITAKLVFELESNARFLYYYIASGSDVSAAVATILNSPTAHEGRIEAADGISTLEMGQGGYSERLSSTTLVFTKRVQLYIDAELTPVDRSAIVSAGLVRGLYVAVKDREYARVRSAAERPLAFISHDSRDKEAFVRELAQELIRNMCPVWYDEFSLKVGDSLRTSIDRGMKEVRKCIVVLSPNFFANDGWGKAEFDSVFTREIFEKKDVILPVWLNVDANSVYAYNARLLNKFGLSASLGVVEVARRLTQVIKAAD